MSRAVTAALVAAPPEDRDSGAVALIKNYAALIDEAAPAARYRKPLERLTRAVDRYFGDDAEQVAEALEVIRTALASHSVASDLGPKLLAALTSLGLTVAGRGARKNDGGNGDQRRDPLDELFARRQRGA